MSTELPNPRDTSLERPHEVKDKATKDYLTTVIGHIESNLGGAFDNIDAVRQTADTGSVDTSRLVGVITVTQGGTEAITASGALANLLPVQSGNAGKALITNASSASFGYPAGLTISGQTEGSLLIYTASAYSVILPTTDTGMYLRGGIPATWASPASALIYSSGSGSWTATFSGTIFVTLAGGGGGGGGGANSGTAGAGGGGACGAQIMRYPYTVASGTSYDYSIGTGGRGGNPDVAGSEGSDTIFATMTAKGGRYGLPGTTAAGGLGGTMILGYGLMLTGQQGGGPAGIGGNGAPSMLGQYGPGSPTSSGLAAVGYAAGGGGGANAYTGGSGAPGIVIIEW